MMQLNLSKIDRWLSIQIFLLFVLFPTVTQWSNIPMFLIVISWFLLLKQKSVVTTIKSQPILWILIAVVAVILVGLVYTPATPEWINPHLRKYARFFYVIVLVTLLINTPHLQKTALSGFMLAMSFVLASTWLNIWFLLPWSVTQALGWGQSHIVFGDYITQNVMMSLFVILCFHRFVQTHHKLRWLWFLTGLLGAISITHLSQGRTGFMLLAVAMCAFILIIAKKKYWLSSFIVLAAILTFLFVSSDIVQERFKQGVNELIEGKNYRNSTIGHRLYNYKTTVSMIAKKPLFGHGTGAYHTEICQYLLPDDDCTVFHWHPHSQFLLIGADHGAIGLLLYAGLIWAMFYIGLKTRDPLARILMLTLATMLLFNSLINSPWWSTRESQFFSYMLALAIAMCANKNKSDHEDPSRS